MGRPTPLQIRNLKAPGRYSDGDGLYLELTGQNKGNWQLRATVNGRRRDIGLGSLALVTLKEARDAAFELRRDALRRGAIVHDLSACPIERTEAGAGVPDLERRKVWGDTRRKME